MTRQTTLPVALAEGIAKNFEKILSVVVDLVEVLRHRCRSGKVPPHHNQENYERTRHV